MPTADRAVIRFIPTPVGNAVDSVEKIATTTVHPHARGERAYVLGSDGRITGSSPRPWGTQGRGFSRFLVIAVHPHARGER